MEKIIPRHVTFEALENEKVAMAEFAAAALSKGANETPSKDMTILQSALFTLQHQQVFQMQLIEQLQFQLAKTNASKEKKRDQLSQSKQNDRTTVSKYQKSAFEVDAILKNSDER